MKEIKRFSSAEIKWYRSNYLSETTAELDTHIGHFMVWFAVAELHITYLLLWILKMPDFERVDFIARGLDAKSKCERLQQAAKKYAPLGPNLTHELAVFQAVCISTRNRIAHSWPILNKETRVLYWFSVSSALDPNDSMAPVNKNRKEWIHLDDLMSEAMWLNQFALDVKSALDQAVARQPVEISHERWGSRLGANPQTQHSSHPAISRKNRTKPSRPQRR